jgi:TPR repeat protein
MPVASSLWLPSGRSDRATAIRGDRTLLSRFVPVVAVLWLAACSADQLYWGNTPPQVRSQLDRADRLMERGETTAARERFEAAAATGHPEALIRAGRAWLAEPDADPGRAQELLELAWERRSARREQAGFWLARAVVDDDPDRAIALLETVDARGEPRVAGELAKVLAEHRPDDPRIEGLLRRAAAEGDVRAMLILSSEYGDLEVAQATAEVLKARHADGDLYAASRLAGLYAADGPMADPEEELIWIRRAAERGHSGSMLNFGRILLAGEVVTRDPYRGLQWIRRAAEADNAWAQLELGRRLSRGDGVEPNPVEARTWLERAAAQGNAQAERALADL